MSQDPQNEVVVTIEVGAEKKLEHFTASLIRWILNETENPDWETALSEKSQILAREAKNLGDLPSETDKKGAAALKAVPAAVLYWLGLYTGIFWIIPGATIGLIGSYFVSESIYDIFKAGKDARFYRTFLHYLLRMENADGVISREEVASLRTIIEFIPVPAEEKKQWLAAIESPEGYQLIIPDQNLSTGAKEQILSGCWGLALCDGSADAEYEIFAKFGVELSVTTENLKKIQHKVEAKIARHAYLTEEVMRTASILHPSLAAQDDKAAAMLTLISIRSVLQSDWKKRINQTLSNFPIENPCKADNEYSAQILLSSLLLAKYVATTEQQMCIGEAFSELCREAGMTTRLVPLTQEISRAVAML